jgi:hypothetical protein
VGKPNLLPGLRLPFHELDPDAFQRFVHGALTVLGPSIGLRLDNLPGPGGDDGFDTYARAVADDGLVCIQCKRVPRLTASMVAAEVAKVAMSTALDDSSVAAHYFVCSGRVQREVDRMLRESKRETLKRQAYEASMADDLRARRALLSERGISAEDVVSSYIRDLQAVVAWSGEALDAKLGAVWAAIEPLVERHFGVPVLVRERPRPDFDEDAYLRGLQREPLSAILNAQRTPPPKELVLEDIRNVSADAAMLSVISAVSDAPLGLRRFLVGAGGGGKSTAATEAVRVAASRRQDDLTAPLPVLVALVNYRTSLDQLILEELGITVGSWRSLPGNFLLIFDGLNEVRPAEVSRVAREIDVLARDGRYAVVVTCRSDGLRYPVRFAGPADCWQLADLEPRQVRLLLESHALGRDVSDLVGAVDRRLGGAVGAPLFGQPFAIAGVCGAFRATGKVPGTAREIVTGYVNDRFQRNTELISARGDAPVSRSVYYAISAEVSYALSGIDGVRSVSMEELEEIVHRALASLRARSVFGVDSMTDRSTVDMLLDFEVVVRSRGGQCSCSHEIVAAYFSAFILANTWQEHVESLKYRRWVGPWALFPDSLYATQAELLLSAIAKVDTYAASAIAVAAGIEAAATPVLIACEGEALRNEVDTSAWLFALATLATTACHQKLLMLTYTSLRENAERALAILGDRRVLAEVLKACDRRVSIFTRDAGGELDVWHTAPKSAALDLARARLDSYHGGEFIGASVATIGRLGDERDVPRLLRVAVVDSPDSHEGLEALFQVAIALSKIDVLAGRNLLLQASERVEGERRWQLLLAAARIGGVIEVGVLVGLAVRDGRGFDEVAENAAGVLCGMSLESDVLGSLFQRLPALSSVARARLWRIAAQQRRSEFDSYFESGDWIGGDDVGCIFAFATRRDVDVVQRHELARKFMGAASPPRVEYSWNLATALVCMWKWGYREWVGERFGEILGAWLADEVDPRDAAREPERRNTAARDADLRMSLFHPLFDLARDRVPEDLRIRVLYRTDPMLNDIAAHRNLLVGVAPERIDEALLRIGDARVLAIALAKVAPLGSTPLRLELLRKVLPQFVHWHLYWSLLRRVVSWFWCDDLALAAVGLVTELDWSDRFAPNTEANLMHAGFPFDREQVERLVEPAIEEQRDYRSRNVLLLWARQGRRRPREM